MLLVNVAEELEENPERNNFALLAKANRFRTKRKLETCTNLEIIRG